MEYATLNNGAKLPVLGLGTWQVKDENELAVSLRTALDNGYRLIDTAHLYQNEAFIGNVLQEYISSGKIKREELFITTKLPFTAHAPEDVPTCVEQQLKALQLDYIDLYLMHCPFPYKKTCNNTFAPLMEDGQLVPSDTSVLDTWKALETLHDSGKLKALGMSNFSVGQIKHLYSNATVKPANLQVECHAYWPQKELRALCKELNITFTAYAPLGSPGRKAARPDGIWPEGDPMADSLIREIAHRHSRTCAQVLLRHLTQHEISAIPKSVNPDRVIENISIFDFKLSDGEMRQIDAMDTRIRLFVFDFAKNHPNYPKEEMSADEHHSAGLKLH